MRSEFHVGQRGTLTKLLCINHRIVSIVLAIPKNLKLRLQALPNPPESDSTLTCARSSPGPDQSTRSIWLPPGHVTRHRATRASGDTYNRQWAFLIFLHKGPLVMPGGHCCG